MVQMNIFREKTAEDEYTQLSVKSVERVVKDYLTPFEAKATKEQIPFCYFCAKRDKVDEIEKIYRDAARDNRPQEWVKEKIETVFKTTNQYFNKERFKLLDKFKEFETARMGVTVVKEQIGITERYICQICSRKRDVLVEEKKPETKGKEQEKKLIKGGNKS